MAKKSKVVKSAKKVISYSNKVADAVLDAVDNVASSTKITKPIAIAAKAARGVKNIGNALMGTNHPEWYMKDKTMLNSLVGINVGLRQNASLDRIATFFTSDTGTQDVRQFSIPSGAGVKLELTIPKSITNDWVQGVNILYKNVRAANAGSTNGITAGQYGNYILMVRVMDTALSILGRAIKTLNSGTFYDALSPMSLFRMYGLDYDSFADNSANVRELYNRLAAIRFRLCPLNISLLDRTRWLFSNVFKDSDDAKAQLYAFYTQDVYYPLSDGTVKFINLASDSNDPDATGMTWEKFSENILTIFDDYQTDSNYQIISGDILKAYGKESLTRYPIAYNDQTLDLVYDENVLTQIQNASLSITGNITQTWTKVGDFLTADVVEKVPGITGTITGNDVAYPNYIEEAFNKHIINPTYNANKNITDTGLLLSSTRLMNSKHAENSDSISADGYIIYDTFGTEIVERIRVYVFAPAEENVAKYGLVPFEFTLSTYNGRVAEDFTGIPPIPAWTWFDYFPYIVPRLVDAVNQRFVYSLPYFDFNNFGIAYKSNLDSYNAIATLSMLYKPFVAKVNKVEVFE